MQGTSGDEDLGIWIDGFKWGAVVGGIAGLLVGVLVGVVATHARRDPPQQKLPVPVDLHLRVAELEHRADAQDKLRCLNVVTDRIDVGIFPVERIAKQKPVPPPTIAPAAVAEAQ